jgi:hypothetical protein
MAGAMAVLTVADYIGLAPRPWYSSSYGFPFIHSKALTTAAFYGSALVWALIPAALLLVRNLCRPRFWAGRTTVDAPTWPSGCFPTPMQRLMSGIEGAPG